MPKAQHRSYRIEFKRQMAHKYLAGDTLPELANRHGISRNLIRLWVEKYEAGSFDDDEAACMDINEAGLSNVCMRFVPSSLCKAIDG